MTLTIEQLWLVLATRSERESFFRLGWRSNPHLLGAVALTLVFQLLVIYLPAGQRVLRVAGLSPWELGVALAASTLGFWAIEWEKWRRRRAVGTGRAPRVRDRPVFG